MSKFVSMGLYEQYKKQVWDLSLAVQTIGVGSDQNNLCLTDAEIGERLGLETEVVTEIRCIAENDLIPMKDYFDAEDIKELRFKSIKKQP